MSTTYVSATLSHALCWRSVSRPPRRVKETGLVRYAGGSTRASVVGVTIEPDIKDWTWVLSQQCPECGLTASEVVPTEIGARVRADLPRWEAVLTRPDARERPSPAVWSPTEYACHVRDVYVLFAERVELMLDQDDPQFANWNQDETAIEQDYGSQDPAVVAEELVAAGDVVARVFDNVAADSWDRTGRRSDGSTFTVATLGQYFIHDIVHHLHDVDA